MPRFCSPLHSSTISYSQETKKADVRSASLTEVVIIYSQLCISVCPIQYETCYFAFTFQHLADALTIVEKKQKEEYKLNSKAVQSTLTIFSKSNQRQLQETNHKSLNTVVQQKSIGIQTCLSCQHKIKDTVTNIVEELVLNVENQFLVDVFDCENVYSNTSKSEYKTEDDTGYEPVNLFKSWPIFRVKTSWRTVPPDNLVFIAYWSSLVLLLQYCFLALPKHLSTVCLYRDML